MMCVTSGVDGGKAATIFDVMDEKFTKEGIPWLNAIGLSVDNTNAMIGRNNSIASHCKAKNQSIFISGCPCHLAHLAATAANDSFTEAIGVNVEYFCDTFEAVFYKIPVDALYEEFCDYRSLSDGDISGDAWQAAKVVDAIEGGTEVFHHRERIKE